MTDPFGPRYDDEEAPRHGAPGRRTLRDRVGDVVWRYQSARLSTQVTIDVVAAAAVMAVVVGAAMLLRDDTGPAVVSAAGPTTTVTRVASAAPPVAPTTTATTVPTTTAPPPSTTTTRPRSTTTAPTAPPATEAPPPTSAPPPSEPARRPYRDCLDAWLDGALPLFAGEPGYAPSLDRDGDGEACEWDERDRDSR